MLAAALPKSIGPFGRFHYKTEGKPISYCLISLFHLTNRYAALSQKHTLADISADARIFVGTSRGMCMFQTHNLACHLAPVSYGPCLQCAF